MSYRKFKADHLFTGHTLLSKNEVLITKQDGEIISIINETEAGDDIEVVNGILCPGFVNAHCHLELSHMKGLIAEKTGLVDFVFNIVNERHKDKEEIIQAIEKAGKQMKESGIVAVGDICNTSLTLPYKLQNDLNYYNFIEASGWMPSLFQLRWNTSKSVYDEFLSNYLIAAIVPHAPYSVSDNLWKELMPHFKHRTVSIHNQETAAEDEFFLHGTGDLLKMYKKMGIDNSFFLPPKQTSLKTFLNKMSDAASVILVHNTFISQNDINHVNENTPNHQLVSFCLCPNANLYIENTLPPVELLVKNNSIIILGTDSLASNYSLNILDEIKTITKNFPSVSLEKVLRWATFNGAKALQMENLIGSFEPGKKSGVVLITHVVEKSLTQASASKRML